MNFLTLVVYILAVWRISHALVKENGPLMIFTRLRARLGRTYKRSGGLFDAFSCVYCISFWIGLIASLFVSHDFYTWIGYGFAFSGGAMILEALFNKLKNNV